MADDTKSTIHCRDCVKSDRSAHQSAYTGRIEPGWVCTKTGKRTPVGPGHTCAQAEARHGESD
jgi:hypothetical protein